MPDRSLASWNDGPASVGRNSAAHSADLQRRGYSVDAGSSPQLGSRRNLLFTMNLLDRHSNLLVANIDALRVSGRLEGWWR